MESYYEKAVRASGYILERVGNKPDIAIVLGSGLGAFAERILDAKAFNYTEIPYFSKTSIEGHKGKLVFGRLGSKTLIVMGGRFHYYEGYEMEEVVFPIRVLKLLGISDIIITNAAGGINPCFKQGDIMIIRDHIGLFAPSVLRGRNEKEFGVRFPDMSEVYDRNYIEKAKVAVQETDIELKEGIYAYSKGPMYETPAEINALKILGADAVGMSTVPEAIAAKHLGMKIIGISYIANMAAGSLNRTGHGIISHEDVIKTVSNVKNKFSIFIERIIENLN